MVIVRLWGYGPVVIENVVTPTASESYGSAMRRFTSCIKTPFLYALPVTAIVLRDTE